MSQKFHSLSEIDPEFWPALELLMKDEVLNKQTWLALEALEPEHRTFTYWLFFGPTHNDPVGLAQLCLEKIDPRPHLPWWLRIFARFIPRFKTWSMAHWKLAHGTNGSMIADPKFAKSCKGKLLELIHETAKRPEVVAQTLLLPAEEIQQVSLWENPQTNRSESMIGLKPLARGWKTYRDYLQSLSPQGRARIEKSWQQLHKEKIQLGEYQNDADKKEFSKRLPDSIQEQIATHRGVVLSFEKDSRVIGVILLTPGAGQTYFAAPMPLELPDETSIPDELYIQHAILKWLDIEGKGNFVLLNNHHPILFNDAAQVEVFSDMGFQLRPLTQLTLSRSPYFHP